MTNSDNFQPIEQKILTGNVVGGNLTVGDIKQIYDQYINLDRVPKPTGFPQNIPRSNTDKFVGREADLVLIYQYLEENNSSVISAVQGMGGVGKTELATQYCLLHLQANTYPGGICWVRIRSEDVGLQIIEFTRIYLGLEPPEDLDLTARVEWCWSRWNEGKTLIVLDDVTDYSSIQPYLPPQVSRFKVLITTRLKLDLHGSLSLEVLSESDALELLAQLIGSDKLKQELEKAKELCRRLGNLPLALQLVGRYVKKRKISLVEMLSRLEENGLEHSSLKVDKDKRVQTLSIERGVKAAFELSWEELSPAAQELGCLLSLFALSAIPWSLVEIACPDQDVEELEDARLELEALHLLQGEGNYQLHQLIREFLKTKHNQSSGAKEQKSHFCQAMVKVAQAIPNSPTQHDIKSVEDVIPHLTEVAENLIDAVSNESLICPFVGIGKYYEGQGLYKLAGLWQEQCVSLLKNRLGKEHLFVIISYNNLAHFYNCQGRYSEAEPLYQQALVLMQKLLGEDHPDVATSYNNLALLYRDQGKYSEAELLYQKALVLMQKLLGEDHPDVATSYNNLALLYFNQGRYGEAELIFQKALALRLKLLGEDHPDVATSYNDLALLYNYQGRYGEVELIFQKALALYVKLLGEDHPYIATSYNNLAQLYSNQRRYSEAELIFQKALALRLKLLGEDHPDVATSYNNLGGLYYSQGRYSDAEPLFQKDLALSLKLLGEDHPDVATSYNNLGGLYYSQGRYSDAEPLFQQALELRQKLLGEDHPDVTQSYNNLAGLYSDQGRYSDAEPLFQQALAIATRTLGENHPNTNTFRKNLEILHNNTRKNLEFLNDIFS